MLFVTALTIFACNCRLPWEPLSRTVKNVGLFKLLHAMKKSELLTDLLIELGDVTEIRWAVFVIIGVRANVQWFYTVHTYITCRRALRDVLHMNRTTL